MLLGEEAGDSSPKRQDTPRRRGRVLLGVNIYSSSDNAPWRIVLDEGMLLGEEAGYSSAKIDTPHRGMLLGE